MSKNITFQAGERALAIIKEEGLTPDRVKVIAGAAGGPKWLVLNRLDRAIFTSWLKGRTEPLFLIGSSIGAWRFSVMSRSNPIEAQQRFEFSYLNQRYNTKPTPQKVTYESKKIMDDFLGETGANEILNHPYLRLNFMAVRSKWPVSSEKKTLQGIGLTAAFLANAVNRKSLKFFFERALFYHPKDNPPFFNTSDFTIKKTVLTQENLKAALLSSGSIPMVMEGIRDIPNAPRGVYRDGGIIDYHMDIPFLKDSDKIVLYPHFSERIIPGWFDKSLTSRKPQSENMKNVVLVAPSKEYIESLPNKKIPDRNDFKLYRGKDEERIKCWNTVIQKGESLADDFMEAVESGKIKDLIKPLQ